MTKYKQRLIIFLLKGLFGLLKCLPLNRKRIIFESFHGKQYSCNPRAIYEYMSENHKEFELVWVAKKGYENVFSERNLPYVRKMTVQWLYLMATSSSWVINTRMPNWLKKRSQTIYLQTWHGTPLKKLGLDIEDVKMPGTTTERYKKNVREEATEWDFLVSPNAYSTEIFRQAFDYKGTIIESGYPRNDHLFSTNSPSEQLELKRSLGLPEDKKIILYAPTWRDDEYISVGNYRFNLKFDLEKMYETLKDEFVVILRMHYLIADKLEIGQYEGFLYNFSDYEDIRDLYLLSDLLITDYSSVMFDYAVLKKPIIYFAYDFEKYRDSTRGFYFDLERDAPGPIVQTSDELMEAIKQVFYRDQGALIRFHQQFCGLEDGYASKRVVEFLLKGD